MSAPLAIPVVPNKPAVPVVVNVDVVCPVDEDAPKSYTLH
jgi:hypothetical protein